MEKIIDREVAWRIFAHEYNMSDLYVSKYDERAPNYIITPTGVKCNRLFIVGVVTEVENIGHDNNLWKARIADPTGVFTVYAGQYQPEAAIFLSGLEVPAFVALVGKARKYEPEDGNVYLSIRPESINQADAKLRDRWVLDTAELTFDRIKAVEEVYSSGASGDELVDFIQKKDINPVFADGMLMAFAHYENMEHIISELKTVIINAIKVVAPDASGKGQACNAGNEPRICTDERRLYKEMDEKQVEPKEQIAEILEKLDSGKGVQYSMVVETALSSGMDALFVESGIKELMAEGRCYELKNRTLRKV